MRETHQDQSGHYPQQQPGQHSLYVVNLQSNISAQYALLTTPPTEPANMNGGNTSTVHHYKDMTQPHTSSNVSYCQNPGNQNNNSSSSIPSHKQSSLNAGCGQFTHQKSRQPRPIPPKEFDCLRDEIAQFIGLDQLNRKNLQPTTPTIYASNVTTQTRSHRLPNDAANPPPTPATYKSKVFSTSASASKPLVSLKHVDKNIDNSVTSNQPPLSRDFWDWIQSPQVQQSVEVEKEPSSPGFWVCDPELWKKEQERVNRSGTEERAIPRTANYHRSSSFNQDVAKQSVLVVPVGDQTCVETPEHKNGQKSSAHQSQVYVKIIPNGESIETSHIDDKFNENIKQTSQTRTNYYAQKQVSLGPKELTDEPPDADLPKIISCYSLHPDTDIQPLVPERTNALSNKSYSLNSHKGMIQSLKTKAESPASKKTKYSDLRWNCTESDHKSHEHVSNSVAPNTIFKTPKSCSNLNNKRPNRSVISTSPNSLDTWFNSTQTSALKMQVLQQTQPACPPDSKKTKKSKSSRTKNERKRHNYDLGIVYDKPVEVTSSWPNTLSTSSSQTRNRSVIVKNKQVIPSKQETCSVQTSCSASDETSCLTFDQTSSSTYDQKRVTSSAEGDKRHTKERNRSNKNFVTSGVDLSSPANRVGMMEVKYSNIPLDYTIKTLGNKTANTLQNQNETLDQNTMQNEIQSYVLDLSVPKRQFPKTSAKISNKSINTEVVVTKKSSECITGNTCPEDSQNTTQKSGERSYVYTLLPNPLTKNNNIPIATLRSPTSVLYQKRTNVQKKIISRVNKNKVVSAVPTSTTSSHSIGMLNESDFECDNSALATDTINKTVSNPVIENLNPSRENYATLSKSQSSKHYNVASHLQSNGGSSLISSKNCATGAYEQELPILKANMPNDNNLAQNKMQIATEGCGLTHNIPIISSKTLKQTEQKSIIGNKNEPDTAVTDMQHTTHIFGIKLPENKNMHYLPSVREKEILIVHPCIDLTETEDELEVTIAKNKRTDGMQLGIPNSYDSTNIKPTESGQGYKSSFQNKDIIATSPVQQSDTPVRDTGNNINQLKSVTSCGKKCIAADSRAKQFNILAQDAPSHMSQIENGEINNKSVNDVGHGWQSDMPVQDTSKTNQAQEKLETTASYDDKQHHSVSGGNEFNKLISYTPNDKKTSGVTKYFGDIRCNTANDAKQPDMHVQDNAATDATQPDIHVQNNTTTDATQPSILVHSIAATHITHPDIHVQDIDATDAAQSDIPVQDNTKTDANQPYIDFQNIPATDATPPGRNVQNFAAADATQSDILVQDIAATDATQSNIHVQNNTTTDITQPDINVEDNTTTDATQPDILVRNNAATDATQPDIHVQHNDATDATQSDIHVQDNSASSATQSYLLVQDNAITNATPPDIHVHDNDATGATQCDIHVQDNSASGATHSDIHVQDNTTTDVTKPDMHFQDNNATDAPQPDVHVQDNSAADATQPNIHVRNMSALGATQPDIHVHDNAATDAAQPDIHVQNFAATDATQPDIHIQENAIFNARQAAMHVLDTLNDIQQTKDKSYAAKSIENESILNVTCEIGPGNLRSDILNNKSKAEDIPILESSENRNKEDIAVSAISIDVKNTITPAVSYLNKTRAPVISNDKNTIEEKIQNRLLKPANSIPLVVTKETETQTNQKDIIHLHEELCKPLESTNTGKDTMIKDSHDISSIHQVEITINDFDIIKRIPYTPKPCNDALEIDESCCDEYDNMYSHNDERPEEDSHDLEESEIQTDEQTDIDPTSTGQSTNTQSAGNNVIKARNYCRRPNTHVIDDVQVSLNSKTSDCRKPANVTNNVEKCAPEFKLEIQCLVSTHDGGSVIPEIKEELHEHNSSTIKRNTPIKLGYNVHLNTDNQKVTRKRKKLVNKDIKPDIQSDGNISTVDPSSCIVLSDSDESSEETENLFKTEKLKNYSHNKAKRKPSTETSPEINNTPLPTLNKDGCRDYNKGKPKILSNTQICSSNPSETEQVSLPIKSELASKRRTGLKRRLLVKFQYISKKKNKILANDILPHQDSQKIETSASCPKHRTARMGNLKKINVPNITTVLHQPLPSYQKAQKTDNFGNFSLAMRNLLNMGMITDKASDNMQPMITESSEFGEVILDVDMIRAAKPFKLKPCVVLLETLIM